MRLRHGEKSGPPVLLVHGGAGGPEGDGELLRRRREAIAGVLDQVWPRLLAGEAAVGAAVRAVELLEDCPLFNAGRGAVLQSDGLARLSASVMDGSRQKFSAVALVTHLLHPSRLALALQEREQTMLGPLGAQLLARELGIPPQSPVTPEQGRKWLEHLAQGEAGRQGGTVGAVVLDREGRLAAVTSTGGNRGNAPERMSDSATPAGNYASAFAAVACTGIGEQIVDDGVAVRLETRVRDGASLRQASEQLRREAQRGGRRYGWIALDGRGDWICCATTGAMPCGVMHPGLRRAIIF
jgi:L-asparaginase